MTTGSAASPRALAGWLWVLPAALGGALTILIMLVLPPDRTLHGLGDFLLKLSPLVLAVLTIAVFPNRGRLAPVLPVLGMLFYFGVIDSAFFIQVDQLAEAAQANAGHAQFDTYYRFSIFVNAFVVLLALFAFRMGGASTEKVLRLGGAGILILLSGLNDLTMWAMYAWPGGVRPTTFEWASHVSIFIGRVPRAGDMLAFATIHLVLAFVILVVPQLPRSAAPAR
jgi:hypothetical protein